jgi:hypothetical protein
MFKSPPLPPLSRSALASIPAASSVTEPATLTDASPPCLGPKVLAAISPPLVIASAPVVTLRLPAGPVLPGPAIAEMPDPLPSIDRSPGTLTATTPPAAVPNVLLEISP